MALECASLAASDSVVAERAEVFLLSLGLLCFSALSLLLAAVLFLGGLCGLVFPGRGEVLGRVKG